MDFQAIIDKITAGFGEGAIESMDPEAKDPFVVIRAPIIDRVCAFLKADPELRFDSLQLLSAVDLGESLQVVYHLGWCCSKAPSAQWRCCWCRWCFQ